MRLFYWSYRLEGAAVDSQEVTNMHFDRDGDGDDPIKMTQSGIRHGASLRRTKRRWPVGTKLMAEEIVLWKALARGHNKPMNAVLVMALKRLYDEKPVPLD
jgi:hypothetical protein